jgi:hypothetical protein
MSAKARKRRLRRRHDHQRLARRPRRLGRSRSRVVIDEWFDLTRDQIALIDAVCARDGQGGYLAVPTKH